MALTNFQNLSTEEKLAVLRTSAGLQQLNDCLAEGKSLKHIAEQFFDLDSRILYRWVAKYTAHTIAKAVPEVTLFEINDALGL